ncbi:MAG TPA: hydrolase, partial [Gammaproteobacteria bacterium]|nr:hydrolase [Gammaproteobacteria bacterium]
MDYQPEIIAAVESIDRSQMINNIIALTKTAKLFDMPIALTTVAVEAGYN